MIGRLSPRAVGGGGLCACLLLVLAVARPAVLPRRPAPALVVQQRPGAGGRGGDDAGDPLPADRHLDRLDLQHLRRGRRAAGPVGPADRRWSRWGRSWPGAAWERSTASLVAGLGLPSIVVTLATLVIGRESLRYVREGEFVRDLPPGFQWFGAGQSAGQWMVVAIALAVFAAFAWGLRNLAAGRAVYATGSDPEAARLAGIRPRRVVFGVFVAMGALAGLAALLNAVRFADVDPNAGAGLELQVIAAVVVGGVADLRRPRHPGGQPDRRRLARLDRPGPGLPRHESPPGLPGHQAPVGEGHPGPDHPPGRRLGCSLTGKDG